MTRSMLFAASALVFLSGCEVNVSGSEQAQAEESNAITENAAVAEESPEAAQISLVAVPRETATRLMKERHDNYEKIGDAMKLISRELRGDNPDLAAVRTGATTIATLAPQVPGWFPAGTGPDVAKTHARAEIWQRPEDFSAKADAFAKTAQSFETAAQGTDVAAIRAAHANLGKSCKACHDLYREED